MLQRMLVYEVLNVRVVYVDVDDAAAADSVCAQRVALGAADHIPPAPADCTHIVTNPTTGRSQHWLCDRLKPPATS